MRWIAILVATCMVAFGGSPLVVGDAPPLPHLSWSTGQLIDRRPVSCLGARHHNGEGDGTNSTVSAGNFMRSSSATRIGPNTSVA